LPCFQPFRRKTPRPAQRPSGRKRQGTKRFSATLGAAAQLAETIVSLSPRRRRCS
jgi:hypothetical protein